MYRKTRLRLLINFTRLIGRITGQVRSGTLLSGKRAKRALIDWAGQSRFPTFGFATARSMITLKSGL